MSSFFFETLDFALNTLILKDIINLFLMAEFQLILVRTSVRVRGRCKVHFLKRISP